MATYLTEAGQKAFDEPSDFSFDDGTGMLNLPGQGLEPSVNSDDTDPEPFRISVHDLDTRPKCVTCGRDMDILSAFSRGVRHCLKVLYDKLLERMSPDLARNLVNWVKSDPGLD